MSYWTTEKGVKKSVIEYTFRRPISFDLIMLQEDITQGQRIEKFHVEVWWGKEWETLTQGTTVGYKRILLLPRTRTMSIRLVIDESRGNPALAEVGLNKIDYGFMYSLDEQ